MVFGLVVSPQAVHVLGHFLYRVAQPHYLHEENCALLFLFAQLLQGICAVSVAVQGFHCVELVRLVLLLLSDIIDRFLQGNDVSIDHIGVIYLRYFLHDEIF